MVSRLCNTARLLAGTVWRRRIALNGADRHTSYNPLSVDNRLIKARSGLMRFSAARQRAYVEFILKLANARRSTAILGCGVRATKARTCSHA
jgi:hypothetical protein